MARLTQAMVDGAEARDSWVSDGDGLLLRTSASGRHSWVWHRRVAGRAKRTKIAPVSRMSLAEARAHVARGGTPKDMHAQLRAAETEIAALREQVAAKDAEIGRQGNVILRLTVQHNRMIDGMVKMGMPKPTMPLRYIFNADGTVTEEGSREIGREQRTFAELAWAWFDVNESTWSRNTVRTHRSRLTSAILPVLGDRPAAEISAREVADFVNGAPSTATRNKWQFIIRSALALGVAEGELETNVGEAARALVTKKRDDVQHRAALAVEDAPSFYATLGDSAPEQALRLLMLTGTRINAVVGGDRSEVDGDVWTVPEARQSKGKITPRVPLVPEALACVDGLGVAADRIRRLIAGRDFTCHGMRATFRTWAEREGIRYEVAEWALGHPVGGQVERAYQRCDLLDERREVMARWADYLTGGK